MAARRSQSSACFSADALVGRECGREEWPLNIIRKFGDEIRGRDGCYRAHYGAMAMLAVAIIGAKVITAAIITVATTTIATHHHAHHRSSSWGIAQVNRLRFVRRMAARKAQLPGRFRMRSAM